MHSMIKARCSMRSNSHHSAGVSDSASQSGSCGRVASTRALVLRISIRPVSISCRFSFASAKSITPSATAATRRRFCSTSMVSLALRASIDSEAFDGFCEAIQYSRISSMSERVPVRLLIILSSTPICRWECCG